MKAGTLLAVTFVLIFLTAIPVRAGKFAGIEPGRSTKEEVEAALGAPLATVSGGERYDYDGKRYQAKVISIRYSPEDFVVENIDIYPIPETFKTEYQYWFALAAPTSTEEDETGNLVEYYFPQAVILHYQGPTDVEPVEYFSHVPFEKSEPEKILERVGAEEPTLTASPSSVRPGDFITLKFSGAPGNTQDWIGLHPVDAPSARYGEWYYLEGKTEGELSFTAPEKEGDYEFRLFANWPEGGYEAIAISDLIRVGIKPLTPGLDNQLLKAAGEGDMEQVQEALQSGAKVNTKDENGWTPLLRASGKGYTDIVRTLIQAGADLDWEATTGQTALNVAALEGHIEIVRALIEAGAEMNEKSKNAQIDYFKDATAIFMASRAGHTEIVWMLVQSGAEVDARNSRGDTPLFLAALFGHTDTVRALIETGADVNATGRYGETSLMLAAVEGQNDIVEMLIQAGADVNRKAVGDEQGEGAGWTALMIAAMAGHTDVVSRLLTAGADPKTTNDAGENALDIAKSEGNKEAVRLLEAVKRVSVDAPPERRIEQDFSSLNDSLVAYYLFNGNVNDESGNGNDGTVHGASLTEDRFGKVNSAYSFDGVDDYVDTSVGEDLPQTVAAWVKPDSSAQNAFMTVLDSDRCGYYGQGIEISYPGRTPQLFQVDTHNSFYDTERRVEWDVWQHVVAVYTSGNVRFYHNGILIHSQDYSQGDLDGKAYTIGNHCRPNSGHFKGAIDDVRIYNRALSESEIQELYELGSSPPVRVTVPTLPTLHNDTFRLSSGKLITGELLSFDGSVFKIKMEAGVIEKKKEEITAAWLGIAP